MGDLKKTHPHLSFRAFFKHSVQNYSRTTGDPNYCFTLSSLCFSSWTILVTCTNTSPIDLPTNFLPTLKL